MDTKEEFLQLLKDKQFDTCTELVRKKTIPEVCDLIVQSKVYKKGKIRRLFWESILVVEIADIILSFDDRVDLFHPLFSFNTPVNLLLLSKIWKKDAKFFTTLFKRFKRYQLNGWIDIMNNIAKSMPSSKRLSLRMLAHEAKMVSELEEQVNCEELEDFQKLSTYPLDSVLIGVSFVHEHLMQNKRIEGDNDYKKSHDVAIAYFLNGFLKYKLSTPDDTNTISYTSNDQLQEVWEHFRPKHKTEVEKPITFVDDPVFAEIAKIVNREIGRQSMRYLIESFCAEMCYFEGSGLDSVQYNSKHELYRKNDSKVGSEELFFDRVSRTKTMEILAKNHSTQKEETDSLLALMPEYIDASTSNMQSIFEFFNIPFVIPDTNIDLKLCHNILVTFSWYKAPKSNFYHRNHKRPLGVHGTIDWRITSHDNVTTTTLNTPPKVFLDLFGTNAAIYQIDYETLLEKIQSYWSKPFDVIKENVDFLIMDLKPTTKPSHWFHRPFIKVGKRVYWLGRILKDRRWDNLLRNKLKSDKTYADKTIVDTLVQTIDHNLEIAVARIFEKKEFHCITTWSFPHPINPKKEGGDIDVVAYRDQCLFVIQVKNGSGPGQIRQASYIEDKQLMNQAAKQLDNSIAYIENHWEDVQNNLHINKPRTAVTVYPLIVTNVYEGDLKVFKGYKKISMMELHIILNNLKGTLYRSIAMVHNMSNRNNVNYKSMTRVLESPLDLWNGKTSFSPKILIDCIEHNEVWKELDEIRDFK